MRWIWTLCFPHGIIYEDHVEQLNREWLACLDEKNFDYALLIGLTGRLQNRRDR